MGETVFFGYDQAALDREYDNRGKVIITELGEPGTPLSRAILRQMGLPAAPEPAAR